MATAAYGHVYLQLAARRNVVILIVLINGFINNVHVLRNLDTAVYLRITYIITVETSGILSYHRGCGSGAFGLILSPFSVVPSCQ